MKSYTYYEVRYKLRSLAATGRSDGPFVRLDEAKKAIEYRREADPEIDFFIQEITRKRVNY